MKLSVLIPAYNEESTIGQVIDQIPKKLDSIDKVDIIVINDGSTDNTKQIAKETHKRFMIQF